MELHYISLPYAGNYDEAAAKLHINEDFADDFRAVFAACTRVARPKGVFGACAVAQAGGDTCVGGQRFTSRVLSVNFAGVTRAYPYIITCGRELYELSRAAADPLERYWIDAISELALREAGLQLHRAVMDVYGLGQISSVNPGSLADFPLPCQRALFALLAEGPARIGVELTDSFLMLPHKSGSGIYYESAAHFENCSLCPRENCPNRRAPFSEALFRETYALHLPQ